MSCQGFVAITQLTFECEVFQLLKEVSTLSVLNAGSKAMQVFIANCDREDEVSAAAHRPAELLRPGFIGISHGNFEASPPKMSCLYGDEVR